MQLLQSWKESLSIFLPKNFKLFFLVTLKAILETISALVRYCWAPILIMLLGGFVYVGQLSGLLGFFVWPSATLAPFLWTSGFFFLLIFLAARSSVLRKGYWYFVSYWYYWGYVFVFMIMCRIVGVGLFVFIEYLRMDYPFFSWMTWYGPGILLSFFMLFLLDSDGRPKTAALCVWRAIKMGVYNLPGAILIWLVGFVSGLVCASPVLLLIKLGRFAAPKVWSMGISPELWGTMVESFSYNLGLFICTVVLACFMTNFYIKRLHDQCGIYFETKEKE